MEQHFTILSRRLLLSIIIIIFVYNRCNAVSLAIGNVYKLRPTTKTSSPTTNPPCHYYLQWINLPINNNCYPVHLSVFLSTPVFSLFSVGCWTFPGNVVRLSQVGKPRCFRFVMRCGHLFNSKLCIVILNNEIIRINHTDCDFLSTKTVFCF